MHATMSTLVTLPADVQLLILDYVGVVTSEAFLY
jgi:hypothetical protein